MAVFVDEDLLAFDTVWAAAGTPRCVFAVSPVRLTEAVGASPMRMA
jgi:prolyl-tRNA editing enzyme YbaK/EbsC (Cys-tRNA(Pro) deacylase)